MSPLPSCLKWAHRRAPNFLRMSISMPIAPVTVQSWQQQALCSPSHQPFSISRHLSSFCSISDLFVAITVNKPSHMNRRSFDCTSSSLPCCVTLYRSCSSESSVSSTSSGGKLKIYTKTGDKGESSLYDGQRRKKDDPTFDALGDVDELNSALGLSHEYCSQVQMLSSTRQQIEEIQCRLLDVGSAVATPLNSLSTKKIAKVKFNAGTVAVLEKWIDQMDEELPQLTTFILPSGGLPAASLHVARSICRRAERKVVTLVDLELVDRSVAQYLNRLSDYLFTAARYAALKLEKPETVWVSNKR